MVSMVSALDRFHCNDNVVTIFIISHSVSVLSKRKVEIVNHKILWKK